MPLCVDEVDLVCRGWRLRSGKFIFYIQDYDDLIDEFMRAVKQAFGEKILIQVCSDIFLETYEDRLRGALFATAIMPI